MHNYRQSSESCCTIAMFLKLYRYTIVNFENNDHPTFPISKIMTIQHRDASEIIQVHNCQFWKLWSSNFVLEIDLWNIFCNVGQAFRCPSITHIDETNVQHVDMRIIWSCTQIIETRFTYPFSVIYDELQSIIPSCVHQYRMTNVQFIRDRS